MTDAPRNDAPLFELYESVSMETAMLLEDKHSDAELGLVVESDNRYPVN